jgi:fatty acid desaturase
VTESPKKAVRTLEDEEFKLKLQRLRRTDNRTNWYYIARTYLFLLAVIGGAVWFHSHRSSVGLPFWCNIPVTLAAILMVGAGQHQLSGLAHEAVHHTLFKDRYLNDLISEWLCSFPVFSSTFHYGLHHLAHHQFVNDPLRDPDITQMDGSGHRLDFPVTGRELMRVMLRQAWVPNLIKYTWVRAQYDSLGTETNPYLRKDWKLSHRPSRLLVAYLVFTATLLPILVSHGNALLLAVVPLLSWLGALTLFGLLPAEIFYQSRIRPLISPRAQTMGRVTFNTALFWTLAWGSLLKGYGVIGSFLLLWIVPLFTSFAFFMMLRQWVQHGNADRGRLTNSRVFFVNPLLRFAIFPFGQDYHLPHHMFATVPHYRLKELHETLLEYPQYREQAVLVEGCVFRTHRSQNNPTVADVLGPEHAPRVPHEIYIDATVLDQEQMNGSDKAAIVRESRAEVSAASSLMPS